MAEGVSNTQFFKVEVEPVDSVRTILEEVYYALEEKGYNPVNQIVGYIMSGASSVVEDILAPRETPRLYGKRKL